VRFSWPLWPADGHHVCDDGGDPSAPTPDLGKPITVHQIGSVTMYVYPYDIAARLFAL
jgi:hypothetical protein